MLECNETHKLRGEALLKLIQVKKQKAPNKSLQRSRFWIAPLPLFEISGYAPAYIAYT